MDGGVESLSLGDDIWQLFKVKRRTWVRRRFSAVVGIALFFRQLENDGFWWRGGLVRTALALEQAVDLGIDLRGFRTDCGSKSRESCRVDILRFLDPPLISSWSLQVQAYPEERRGEGPSSFRLTVRGFITGLDGTESGRCLMVHILIPISFHRTNCYCLVNNSMSTAWWFGLYLERKYREKRRSDPEMRTEDLPLASSSSRSTVVGEKSENR